MLLQPPSRFLLLRLIIVFSSSTATLLLWLCILSSATSTIITHLPGFNGGGALPFHLETGYVSVEDDEASQQADLFYYFVESERNPREDPLILWLTGGPGRLHLFLCLGHRRCGAMVDDNSRATYAHGMGIVPDELFEAIQSSCPGEDIKTPRSVPCMEQIKIFRGVRNLEILSSNSLLCGCF
ncbi:Serine carboxypeptidase-like 1 [Platanthera zijinensis]|uniref:Serine carboxypeptidase-like 1 n=1 Tax=Platanthera zijinensis TaxID=2320716 RepID=A0AAP0BRW6_9ASPA